MANELAGVGAKQAGPTGIGADELAQGLLLVRASAIKLVRFQLAMERNDRRLALQTVDDLVLLDRRIESFLSEMPRTAESASSLERDLEAQRRALASEKFTLAAGNARRVGRDGAQDGVSVDQTLHLVEPSDVARRSGLCLAGTSSRWLAAGLVLLLMALAFVALFFLADSGTPFAQGAFR